MKKITYIGAGGKIGKQALTMMCSQVPSDEEANFVLIGSGSEESLTRLEGFRKDLAGALTINKNHGKVNFTITNDYSKTADSDLVICSAGKHATKEEFEAFSSIDPSGRLVQSKINSEMIKNIFTELEKYCPNALSLVVTNQVDTMCQVARENASSLEIIGLTGAVDSTRLRQNIKETTGKESEGFMIGYHNSSMTPMKNSINIEIDKDTSNEIVQNTKNMGSTISKQQGAGKGGADVSTGASILPATAIAEFEKTYCFDGTPYIECYNVLITDEEVAKHYGVPVGTSLSIPTRISKGEIKQTTDIELLEDEKIAMREAQKELNKDIKIITTENVLKNNNSLKTLGGIKRSSEDSTSDIPAKYANHTKQACSIQ